MEDLKLQRQDTLFTEWVALALVLVAAVALSLNRIDMQDTPWHLATARVVAEAPGGFLSPSNWPTTNTFSYTYPEHRLYQQYPVYQTMLYAVWSGFDFEGLSVLHCLLWLLALFLILHWAGGLRVAARYSPIALLILLGFQRRMILRPTLLTLVLLLAMLLALEAYRRSRGKWRWVAPIVLLQFLMVNAHQMFTLGLMLQAGFLLHLLLARRLCPAWGEEYTDKNCALRPMLVAFVASIGVCFLSPLGAGIVQVPPVTWESVNVHRGDVMEFSRLWQEPYTAALSVLAALLLLWSIAKNRWRVSLFELALCALGLLLAFLAARGAIFFVAFAAAVSLRTMVRAGTEEGRGVLRFAAIALCVAFCATIFSARWGTPPTSLRSPQWGMGKGIGQWPDQTMAFLKRYPPPGNILNLTWYSGNALIWELYPRKRVYVDPRFEAYPRRHLVEAIAAEKDRELFFHTLEKWNIDCFVGELRHQRLTEYAKELLESGDWTFVAVDPVVFVMVRQGEGTAAYLEEHAVHLPEVSHPEIEAAPEPIGVLMSERLQGFRDTIMGEG